MSTEHVPSRNEDEYFLKLDAELIKEHRARLDAEKAASERQSHWMKCPKCGHDLTEQEFHHVKVDRCAHCGGMFLDAGELEMISHVKDGAIGTFLNDLLKGLRAK